MARNHPAKVSASRVVRIAPADLRALLHDPEANRRLEELGIDDPTVGVFIVRSPDRTTASTVARAVELLPELVVRGRRKVDEERLTGVTEALVRLAPRDETQAAIETDNARLRMEFLKRHKCLNSQAIHRLSGSRASNVSSTANRWKRMRRVFSVPSGSGEGLFPAFQFRDGQPRPVIAEILGALPRDMSPWQTAFWFVSGNGWLADRAPVNCLEDKEAVVAAARRAGEPTIG
jgi:hypothetical protein